MYDKIGIYFEDPKLFEPGNIRPLNGVIGLYFIAGKSVQIPYPFRVSRLLYIGMSERRTNSIGSRLMNHFNGRSNNFGLLNYRKVEPLIFTYINFEMLKNSWKLKVEDLESYFIIDFVEKFGVHPICNNQTGSEIPENSMTTEFVIDWEYFD